MKNRFVADKAAATMGMSSVSGAKPNKCVIFPAKANIVAEAFERRKRKWVVRSKIANDLIIGVGDCTFLLHKLPMVSRSVYLNRLVFDRRNNEEKGTCSKIQIDNFPGGAETFALVVRFCYGLKFDLTAANIAPLYNAAQFLEMTDDLEHENLISKAEAFLTFVLFSSWKDIFQVLKSCETISSWAKELLIVKRCTEAIACKACTDLKAYSFDNEEARMCFNVLPNNAENSKLKDKVDNWWFEDISFLRIDHFLEVIKSIKRRGMRAELVGSCIAQWTTRWLSQIHLGLDNNLAPRQLTHQLIRITTESLITVLPDAENSVSCNFLLHLLKAGLMMNINCELLNKLERRIALMLEGCSVQDLLVKNYGSDITYNDCSTIIRAVEAYVSFVLRDPAPRAFSVGRLIDGFLTQIARDKKLTAESFQSLAEALPKSARYCNDNLYRAMDMYLKAHPSLTEEERERVCSTMDYHKLSQEARQHAMKNDRLPLKIATRFVLLEQVNMTRTITAAGCNCRRTKTQLIVKVSKGLEKRQMASKMELKKMKKEVETMKAQLSELHMFKVELQRQLKQCII
ncbi:root phototropism protein 3-like [Tripterygium wilfordii]|uniref:Root phototropism protein 3-like n=1 Tax=Tripterygium wilfordii TaxID=458696 RepID=A0A7J7D164_TRIWF|nr:root phototropism protein 3-like [Tripterygium wilfordii]KAF5740074.1 root phototropism protein 3-like [Tripterygium wilfordii]